MLDRNQDHPPKDTSEEEIEEWNASAVMSIPVMGHTLELRGTWWEMVRVD